MLTADLVRCRTLRGKLTVSSLSGKTKLRALELAELYLQLAQSQVGGTQEQLKQVWQGVEVGPRERKLALGLQKLIADRCELQADTPWEPRPLRREVFLQATLARAQSDQLFERNTVLEPIAARHGSDVATLDKALYADLPSQHVLLSAPQLSAQQLVEELESAQYQAVLLRAVRVSARVYCKDATAYRRLFHALKFHRLLFTMQRVEKGYQLEIDGPFSLFDSVTKYGLQLAIVFPLLTQCTELELRAELRWGKARSNLVFEYQAKQKNPQSENLGPLAEAEQLLQAVNKLGSGWQAQLSDVILDLPGVGLCVPDLCLSQGEQRVYVELLGFWSRDAVWKRVELVEKGLGVPTVFAVSSRLRVSEAALDESASAALYVYKGVPQARALLQRVQALADRSLNPS